MKTDLIKGRLGRLKQLGTLLIYLAMVLIFTLLKPNYLTLTNFRSILIQAAMLGIISSGMTLVMMTGGVDMSVGAVAGVSTLAGMWPVVFDELPLAVGILDRSWNRSGLRADQRHLHLPPGHRALRGDAGHNVPGPGAPVFI